MNIAGSDGLRRAVAQSFSQYLRDELTAMETKSGLKAGSLSNTPKKAGERGIFPNFIKAFEWGRIDLSKFPALLVLSDGITSSTLVERSDGTDREGDIPADIYRRIYAVRLFGYVQAQTTETASLARDRLELATWRVLMRHMRLSDNAAIEKSTYSTRYSDIEPVNRSKTMISGFESRLTILSYEDLDIPIDGRADTIDIEVVHL